MASTGLLSPAALGFLVWRRGSLHDLTLSQSSVGQGSDVVNKQRNTQILRYLRDVAMMAVSSS